MFDILSMLQIVKDPDTIYPTGPMYLLLSTVVLWIGGCIYSSYNEKYYDKMIPLNVAASVVILTVATVWAFIWYYN